jgi:tetratricopeptide (TPR) repeat protein
MAIDADPGHAPSYDGLADCYLWLGFLGALPRDEALSKAKPNLLKALEIDDMLPEAHETLAGIKHYYDWDWLGAKAGYKSAIELNPNFVEARVEYALLLVAMGRFTDAIEEALHAHKLDPLSVPANRTLADVYFHARQYDKAVAQFQQMAELDENEPQAYWGLARTQEQMGRFEEAVKARQKMMTILGAKPEAVRALADAYRESGPAGYWTWLLERSKGRYERDPVTAAKYYAQLGDKDEAFAWLEKAYEKRDPKLFPLKVHPCWDPLRDDPRFEELLRRMNFPADETQE